MLRISFSFLLLLFTLNSCTIEKDEEKKGPNGSWWLGGADGGVYIKIDEGIKINDNLYEGTIYFEHDMTIWYQGSFKLMGNLDFSINNHDLYNFWDGERVQLKESSYLEAIDPVPPI